MQNILVKYAVSLVGLALWVVHVAAALPDPVTFSRALELGDVAKVRSWLDEGLNPEFQGHDVGTGLMSAAWYGNIEMMQLFLERGANLRRANRNGEQPLQLAVWNGHLEAVKWLLDHGAPVNRDGSYWGALHYSVFNGHQKLSQYLIERGANINARSPNGSTPLMMAAREGRDQLARLLFDMGADARATNDWGDTALILAMRYDHYRVGKIISSPEEFEMAIKAPKEDFGAPSRSASAPGEIEELLNKIREAEATGQPSQQLHILLRQRLQDMREHAMIQRQVRRPLPYQPNAIIVTAKRNQFGSERAEMSMANENFTGSQSSPDVSVENGRSAPSATQRTSSERNIIQARIAELMRQIRLAEARGHPTEALRQELYDAVDAQK